MSGVLLLSKKHLLSFEINFLFNLKKSWAKVLGHQFGTFSEYKSCILPKELKVKNFKFEI